MKGRGMSVLLPILRLWMKLRTGRNFRDEALSLLLRAIPTQARGSIRGIWRRQKNNHRLPKNFD